MRSVCWYAVVEVEGCSAARAVSAAVKRRWMPFAEPGAGFFRLDERDLGKLFVPWV